MIPKRVFVFVAICLLAVAGSFAVDFAGAGFAEKGSRSVDGMDYTVLADAQGNELLLSQLVEISAERLEALKAIDGMLQSWQGLSIASIRATNDAQQLKVIVVPSSLIYQGKELKAGVPGGLAFWYDTAIEYDFRVLSGAYAVRITGLFTSTANLLDSIALAYTDPVKWLLESDPEYAVKRITELTTRVDGLEGSLKEDGDALAATQVELATTQSDLATARADLDKAQGEISSLADSKAESDKTSAATISRLETALMTALNVGFLSGPKPIPDAAVQWVVGKMKEDPTLTKAALVTAAKAEKATVTEKQIGIVLLVLYGQQ